MEMRDTNTLTVQTFIGTKLYVNRDEAGLIFVRLNKGQRLTIPIVQEEIESMLQCPFDQTIDQSLPLCVASMGSPKLLISVKTKTVLNTLKPDFECIKNWSIKTGINGLYVYTRNASPGIDFAARAFNPKGGLNEDPATGVAAGALVSILPESAPKLFIFEQGEKMGRLSHLHVKRTATHIIVGGRVDVG